MAAVAAWAAKAVTAKVISALGIKSLVAAKAIYAATYAATYIAGAAALNAASQALMGGAPDLESGKTSLKQGIPPRRRGYGRRRIGGSYMLWAARDNYAYDVVAFHAGRVEAVEQVWTHDHVLQLGSDGWAAQRPDTYGNGYRQIHVDWRLGAATETAYSAIVAALGGTGKWTSSHRGDGIASIGVDYHHDKQENLLADYPNGDPTWSVTARLSPIWDARDPAQLRDDDSNWKATDAQGRANMALAILDFLTLPREDGGMGEDYETTVAPEIEHWKGEADICDEAVPLKAGGTTKRYWGSVDYALTEDPQDTLDKLLAACDGKLFRTEEGVWKLWVGKYRAPTVTLTADDVLNHVLAGDLPEEEAVTELIPSYVSEGHKWSLVATEPWTDDTDAPLYGGGKSLPVSYDAVNINSQARRLAKREMSRQRAQLRGRIDGRLSCVRAMGERWLAVRIDDLDMTITVEVVSGMRTAFSRGVVEIPFVLADPNADAWNAATEEGDGPQADPQPLRPVLAAPTISLVTVFQDRIGTSNGVRLRIVTNGPDRSDLTWSARWRVAGSSSWVEGTFVDLDPTTGVELETGFVAADDLEVETAYMTGGRQLSPWSDIYEVDAAVVTTGVAARFLTKTEAYPTTSDEDSISVVAFEGVIDTGGEVSIPAGTITGLTAETSYAVFWSAGGGLQAAVEPASTQFRTAGLVFIGWQTTSDAEGTYPPSEPPPGGWGGGGSSCPHEDEPFLLANADQDGPGETIRAGDVRPGMWAWTRHEKSREWGAYRVTAARRVESDLVWLEMEDGRSIRFSPTHRMGLEVGGYQSLMQFVGGEQIDGTQPGRASGVRTDGRGVVVRISVEKAHTYVVAGLSCHNLKPNSPDPIT